MTLAELNARIASNLFEYLNGVSFGYQVYPLDIEDPTDCTVYEYIHWSHTGENFLDTMLVVYLSNSNVVTVHFDGCKVRAYELAADIYGFGRGIVKTIAARNGNQFCVFNGPGDYDH